uniref:Ligand dependent nuclear receptor corepressor-like n=1 Tax=Acanthochromis polyacanthus TaxID=80966 RepID=A0A3Q1HAU9_9TELE
MATVQCTKCTAERKGFRRELDSWRHKLIHCVGFETILEGIYGPLLLRDLNLFDDCEPEEVDDWSPESSRSQCSFCNLPLDKLSDQVPAATSPLSSPSDYSESSQSAHRFLQAVFHKKDVPPGCDSNIPLIAQELMKKMIHQFAMEYASKCLLPTNTNGVTRTSSPLSETSDAPLDLTVSRTQEQKESQPEPDGVLDLSNRNSACSATSSNHKASGSLLPSITEDLGDLGQRGTKFHHSSALDAVLSSLCPAHRSLLSQILKLAHQEKLLSFLNHRPVGQTESHCCHCGVSPQDNNTPHSVTLSECKAHYPLTDCEHQSQGSTGYHLGDSKSNCSIHHFSLKDCNSEGQRGSRYDCVQRCRMETYSVLSSKRLHCISCQSLADGHTNKIVCSFASLPPLSQSPPLCTPSTNFCPSSSNSSNQHSHPSCPCYLNQVCLTQVKNSIERGAADGDPPCPVLKREQSPSPPPLSPISSDIGKTDDKPPSLLRHRQEEEDDLMIKNSLVSANHQEANVDKATEDELQCKTPGSSQAEQNPSGALLQDVMNRFSEKLETIRPLDRDPTLVATAICVSEKEPSQSPSTSQNLEFHADAHLTEIITTVLHTGRASDYNLSELFSRHDNGEAKSPNTRSRRRQEVLAAIATPADDASTRRHTLQIKRELAMLESKSCNRRKVRLGKKAKLSNENVSVTTSCISPDPNLVKEVSKREPIVGVEHVENCLERQGPLNMLSAGSDRHEVKEEIQRVIVTKEIQIIKTEGKEREISSEEKDLTFSGIQVQTPELQCKYSKQGSKHGSAQTKVITVTATSATQCGQPCREDGKGGSAENDGGHKEAPLDQSCDTDNRPGKGKDCSRERQKCQSNHSKGARKSGRSIVPPTRFSSYVTEPRKMFFVACFSESIFNQGAQKDKGLTSSTLHALSKDPDESTNEACLSSNEHTGKPAFESTQKEQHGPSCTKDQCQVSPQSVAAKEKNPKKCSSDNRTDISDLAATPYGRLRSSPRRLQLSKMQKSLTDKDVIIKPTTCVESPPNSQVQYISPIKLMFVSQVKDKDGVKYSLKSASNGSGTQAEESFDPCEESSWSGTPQKHKNKNNESVTSQAKSIFSPLKSATSRTRSACSPTKSASLPSKSAFSPSKSASSPSKSASSPSKSASCGFRSSSPAKSASSTPKSASSPAKSSSSPAKSTCSPAKSTSSPTKSPCSPRSTSLSLKNGSRRSGDGTPTKRVAGTESQGSPGNLSSFHETTPPKRRPGRPKKLGPQLEQKEKRPIGRPRKQKAVDAVIGEKTVNGKCLLESDVEENVNKNLKITVKYGRSRRNKRIVSEGFEQLQTEFNDAWQAAGCKSDLGILLHNSKSSSGSIKTASEELDFVSPVKELAPQSGSNIKCQKQSESVPLRKPGRPAKVKFSGISVTVTTVSPRQRKIQINEDSRQSPGTVIHKKVILPEFRSAKEPWTISQQLTSKRSQTVEGSETADENKDELPDQPVAVRHSLRVRKPSIHFLHAVATSRSYSRSNALVRRSKQLLLNKASNERRLEEQQSSVETSGEKRQRCGQERKGASQDLSKVAGVSVDSIFTPKETLRWWEASAEEKTMNQELARRIRVISDTWVSDTVENQEKELAFNSQLSTKDNSSFTRKSQHSSVVRTLFDCPANKPRSYSMQQICSWFMQTTETQSLAIVKKASSRPYEPRHFPRSASTKTICYSPQAERLRKHIKKFAKTVPKSPLQHRQAQRRLRNRNKETRNIRRQLFKPSFPTGKLSRGVQCWRSRTSFKYQVALFRARKRFLTRKERERWQKRQRNRKNRNVARRCSNGHVETGLQPKWKALCRSTRDLFSGCWWKWRRMENRSAIRSAYQTEEHVDVRKERNLCSKAWSPESLKECRVLLRKINSPDNESAEEESDSCTVTLDDGSPSACLFAGRERELVGVVKAVKTERRRSTSRRTASREPAGSAPRLVQEQGEMPVGRMKRKNRSPGVVSTEPSQPPPAKMLRQSRMRGLTGLKWRDYVFEN